MKKLILIFLLLQLTVLAQSAKIKLPSIFGDNMVLQQNQKINIWGTAGSGEKISIRICDYSIECVADENGKWKTEIPPMKHGGPFEMTIAAGDTIKLKNILIGEVWLASGQSNMEMQLFKCAGGADEIINANYPSIRFFIVKHKVAAQTMDDCEGEWVECSPKSAKNFSGAAFYFAKNLYEGLQLPVGVIQSTWGGTPAEAWMPVEILNSDPDFKPILERWNKKMDVYPTAIKDYNLSKDKLIAEWRVDSAKAEASGMAPPRKPPVPEGPGNRNTPGGLYNGMIYPLAPFNLRGVIWYQGEANASRAHQYRKLFPTLINNWRELWSNDNLPFYFVQLPNFFRQPEPSKSGWKELREAQLHALKLPNTGMAVTIDIGDPMNLHPENKKDIGLRLSYWALNKIYGKKDVICSGPIYESHEIKGDKIILKFVQMDSPFLIKGGGDLKGFEIAGSDKIFYTANAEINGQNILVWNDKVKSPVSVRYAWSDNPDCNLFNKAGLPASPLRTDDWPEFTFGKK